MTKELLLLKTSSGQVVEHISYSIAHSAQLRMKTESGLKLCYFLLYAYSASQGRFLTLFFRDQLALTDSEIGKSVSFYRFSTCSSEFAL